MRYVFFLWAVAYSLVHEFSEMLCVYLGTGYGLVSVMMFLYAAVFVIWLIKTDRAEHIGVKKGKVTIENIYVAAPLAMLPLYNFITIKQPKINIFDILLVLGSVMTEEIFFRGILQKLFSNAGIMSAIVKTNLIFAIYHFVNASSGVGMYFVFVQVTTAFIVGICYSMVSVVYDSILPAATAHILVNITGANSNNQYVLTNAYFICISLYLIYTLFLMKKYKEQIIDK